MFAAFVIGVIPCAAQDEGRVVIADSGVPLRVQPGTWLQQDTYIEVSSGYDAETQCCGLYGDLDLGTGDFHVHARLRIAKHAATGASFQMGESYFGFDGPNRELYLSGALAGGHHVRVGPRHRIIEAGVWFDFDVVRHGPQIEFLINGQLVHAVRSFVPIGQIGFTFSVLGRVTPDSKEGAVHVRDFSASGHLHPAGTIAPRGYNIPLIDLADEIDRQVLVDREPGQYLGHPTTVLLEDGKTIIVVYPKGHGRGAIVMKRSSDGGLTWGDRLPVPKNWTTSQEVPTIYPVADSLGTKRLIMFSGLYPIRMAVSEDVGETWTPLKPIGEFGGIVAMGDLVRLKSGDYLAFFHDDGRFINGQEDQRGQFYVYKTRSRNGGLTWGRPEVVATDPEADLCEPGIIRSPDGSRLAMLLRENSRQYNAFVTFSNDEGETWSEPVELPGALTGDRHQAIYGPDGRLFISFRDRTHVSPTWGDWVGWVGTFADIAEGKEGQYRVRLMDNHEGADTAYPAVELLPDGTVVTTTYGHWTKDEEPYIMSVRFRFEELDERAAAHSND